MRRNGCPKGAGKPPHPPPGETFTEYCVIASRGIALAWHGVHVDGIEFDRNWAHPKVGRASHGDAELWYLDGSSLSPRWSARRAGGEQAAVALGRLSRGQHLARRGRSNGIVRYAHLSIVVEC
jgi:hypothetical protein